MHANSQKSIKIIIRHKPAPIVLGCSKESNPVFSGIARAIHPDVHIMPLPSQGIKIIGFLDMAGLYEVIVTGSTPQHGVTLGGRSM
jgi:hypothetical protein